MSQVFASHTTPLYICFARLFVGWGIQSPVSSHPDIPIHFVEMILFHLFVTALNLYWSLQNYNARNQNRRAVGVFYVPLVVEGGGGGGVAGWIVEAVQHISRIWRLVSQRFGSQPVVATKQLFQQLS